MYIDTSAGINRIYLKDYKTQKIQNSHTIIVSASGGGKTMSAEHLLWYYYNHGYTIISLTDIKDTIELGYTQFKPIEDYHLNKLQRYGVPITEIPVKIYHPFTFNIPNYDIPPINIYTHNIKELGRQELSYITETDYDTSTIRILNDTIKDLTKNEGLHHLIYHVENKSDTNTTKKNPLRSTKPNNFFTKGTQGGNTKTTAEIISYFKPFLNDYFLTPQNTPTNLDIKKILNDRKHYHIFTYKYIKDKKIKMFAVDHLLNQIQRNLNHAKHPILLYIEEMKEVAPDNTYGATQYLARDIKSFLTTARNKGKGVSTISTTQVYWDVNKDVRNSMTQIFLGKLRSYQDIEKISKALRLPTTTVNIIKELRTGEYVCSELPEEDPYTDKIRFFLPPHRHAEEGYDYEETYKENYPEKLTNYQETKKTIEQIRKTIEEQVKNLVEKENKTLQEYINKKEKEIQAKKEQKNITQAKKEVQQKKFDQELAKIWTNEYEEGQKQNPKTSLNEIAKKYNTTKMTIYRAIKKYKALTSNKNEEQAPDTPPNT